MKQFTLILLMSFISFLSLAQKQNDSIILQHIVEMKATLNEIKQQQIELKKESENSIEQFANLTQILDEKKSVWTNILPSLIAILVVIISTGGAIYLGIRQIKTQTTNAEEQIRSQEAQAQDNLDIAREQIRETSIMTLAQVRANNVSQARINWIQDLRNELSQFNGEVAIINFYLKDVVDLIENDENEKAEKLYNEQTDRIKEARQYAFKIKLFLNKDENDHKELERLIAKYYKSALENYSTVKSDFNTISNSILDISRKILKEAWEQAKNEGT